MVNIKQNIVQVKIFNQEMGYVWMSEDDRSTYFQFSDEFIKSGLDVSPILMPLNVSYGKIYNSLDFEYDRDFEKTFKHQLPLISDSLPDDFGNKVFKKWLDYRNINELKPTERLLYVGHRGMGAIEYEPPKEILRNFENFEIKELVKVVNSILSDKKQLQFNKLGEKSLVRLLRVGTSAGGAKAKAIIAVDNKTGEIRPGDITYEDKNYSYWIVKLDGLTGVGDETYSLGYGKIEYAYSQMAKASGINMSETKLFNENSKYHFMTKRFDRVGNDEKLHMQSLGALAGYSFKKLNTYSYEDVFKVINKLNLLYGDTEEQYRRAVFNIIARNQDDHVKNISFLMDKKGKWSLSPAYDISYSNPTSTWTSVHQLSLNGKRDKFTTNDLLNTGKVIGIKNPKRIIEEVSDGVSQWKVIAKELEIPKEQMIKIKNAQRIYLGMNRQKGS